MSAVLKLPGSLNDNRRLSQWLAFGESGVVEVFSGKVEIGQGILTALRQIVAEELDVSPARIRMVAANTAISPDEAVTSGSQSIQHSGAALRQVCAEVRNLFLQAAAARLRVPALQLAVEDGDFVSSEGRTSYWALASGISLDREATGGVRPKAFAQHRVVGTPAARIDLPDKVFGRPHYLHDLEPEGLLHGRVVRGPAPAQRIRRSDESRARGVDGLMAVVRDGDFLGVVASSEAAAIEAARLLAADTEWEGTAALPDGNALGDWLTGVPADTTIVDERVGAGEGAVARTLRAVYTRPYIAHASLGPSCALAVWRGDRLEVWSHSQGIFNLRRDLALTFGTPPEHVVVQHVEAAGCYGHNGADDVALDAALLARAVPGRTVRTQWSRTDELTWSPLSPAMRVAIEADVDGEGDILAWRHAVWSNGHGTRPGREKTPALRAAAMLAQPFMAPLAVDAPLARGGGAERNAVPGYDFPAWKVTKHRLLAMPLRTSALRSLGAIANVFAAESFMDELAHAAGADAIEFRLRRVGDARARAVIEAALAKFGWRDWQAGEGKGRGFGWARYKNTGAWCAVAAEIEAGAAIRVKRLAIAVDVGQVVNPDGVINQIEGGAIQAVSWTLIERVRLDGSRVASADWESYPVIRFSDVPRVEVEILARPDQPSVGAGEASIGPTAAAIGNAVFDALGVRVRDLPMTPERIVAAMA